MRRAPTYDDATSQSRLETCTTVPGVRRVDELAAADVDADVAEAVEEDEVARLRAGRAGPATPSFHIAYDECGSETPTCAYAYMTSPEQSKPPGEAPAQTYGVPMYCIATPTTPRVARRRDDGRALGRRGARADRRLRRRPASAGSARRRPEPGPPAPRASSRGLLLRRSAAGPRRSSDERACAARRAGPRSPGAAARRSRDELLHLRASRSRARAAASARRS